MHGSTPFKLLVSLNHRWMVDPLIDGKGLLEIGVATTLFSGFGKFQRDEMTPVSRYRCLNDETF
jgi:hypothetical protein